MYLPESIRVHLPEGEYTLDEIGRSDADVIIFSDRVLKIQRDCNVSVNEYHMMDWMQGKLPVPEIIAADEVGGNRYLLMSRLYGNYLCTAEFLNDQERLAEIVAEGLKKLWSVEVKDCPAVRSLDEKFKEIEAGLRSGKLVREKIPQPIDYGSDEFDTSAQLFDWLVKNRPEEELVLTHGDYCLPNIFADSNGLTGYLDLGLAGVADKWVDIEKGLWSMWANTTGVFNGEQRPFNCSLLFDALSMPPDDEKLRYYALLGELC